MKDRTKLMFREHLEEMLKNISFKKLESLIYAKAAMLHLRPFITILQTNMS